MEGLREMSRYQLQGFLRETEAELHRRDRAESPKSFDSPMGQQANQGLAGAAAAEASDLQMPWPAQLVPTEEITVANADDAMRYQGWDAQQTAAGDVVREALTLAVKAILRHVPRSPRRTLAVQHLLSARMDANAAISFRGRF